MRASISLLLLVAATAAAQAPGVAATTPASTAHTATSDPDADPALLPDDPEVAEWHTREGSSHFRFTRAVHAGSSGVLHSIELGVSALYDVPPAVIAWPDRREYDLGDTATVYLRNVGTVPGYVALFRVDAQGQAHVLFPVAPADDNYVSQQQTIAVHALPSGGTFAVDSPEGTSLLYAVISRDPLDFYAYQKGGKWSGGEALRVEAPPSDAVTDHWGKLYWELSGLAQRMTEAYSAHLVTYAVAPRATASAASATMGMPWASLRPAAPAAFYTSTFGIGSYYYRRGFVFTHAAEQDGGMLDECFDANGNPTFYGPWCAWQYNVYANDVICMQELVTGASCRSGSYVMPGSGTGAGTSGGPPTNGPTNTPPRSTDIAGKRGASAPPGKGSPPEPPTYIISAFKPRPSASAPVGVPGGGNVAAGGAQIHGGPPEAPGGGGHFAAPVAGRFTPPTSVGGAASRGGRESSGAAGGGNGAARSAPAQSAGGSAPKRVDAPVHPAPAAAPSPPPRPASPPAGAGRPPEG